MNRNTTFSKPRLLIILNRFVIGGQSVDTLPLAWYLQQSFELLIVYGEKEPDEAEPLFLLEQYPGLTLRKIPTLRRSINPITDLTAFFQLLKLLRTFKPHIVHTHGAKSGFLGRLAAWWAKVPVIVHSFHGHLFHSYFSPPFSNLLIAIERGLAKITTAFVTLSPSQWNDLVNRFKIMPAAKAKIIPLGFSVARPATDELARSAFRNKYGLSAQHVAIGIVGRIVPVKNHSLFAKIVKMILDKCTGIRPAFFVIGDGELKSTLQEQLTSLGLSFSNDKFSENTPVVFTSWLSNINEVMSGLDIVVLTSLNEGTPLSVIEAQAYGKPVVATNVGGVKDTMVNNTTGFYVNKEDKQAFTNKLLLLIQDEALRKAMGAAGREFVIGQFSRENEIGATTDFYFSLLGFQKQQPTPGPGNTV